MSPAESGRGARRSTVAELALLAIAMVWGLTFVMVQEAIAVLPPLSFLAWRFLGAATVMALLFHRTLRRLDRKALLGGLAVGACLTAGYVLQTLGLALTSVSNAGFITGLFVVWTPVLGAAFFGERSGAVVWVASAVSALGLYLLTGGAGELRLGDLLVLGCSFAFALHILVTSRVVARDDPAALVVLQLLVCGLICLLAAAASGGLQIPRGGQVWSALLVTSLLASAMGFFVQSYAQRHTSPSRTALILASEPAFAGGFAYWLKGERLTAGGWLGAGLILAAILGVELLRHRGRARYEAPG